MTEIAPVARHGMGCSEGGTTTKTRDAYRHILHLRNDEEVQTVVLGASPDSPVIAVIFGNIDRSPAPLVRVQSRCVYGEVLGSADCDCKAQVAMALARMRRAIGGVFIYLDQEGRGSGPLAKAAAYELKDREGLDTVEAYERLGLPVDSRQYGGAVAMLRHLGLTRIRLLTNNPAKVAAIANEGIRVIRVPLRAKPTAASTDYLEVKQAKLKHDLRLPRRPER